MFTKTCLVATALGLVLATTGKSSRRGRAGKGKDRALPDASDSLSPCLLHLLTHLLSPLSPLYVLVDAATRVSSFRVFTDV